MQCRQLLWRPGKHPRVNYAGTFYAFSYFFLHQTLEEGQGEGLRYKRAFEGLKKNSQQQTIIHSTVKRRAFSSWMQTEFLLSYRVVKMIKEFHSDGRHLMSKMPLVNFSYMKKP